MEIHLSWIMPGITKGKLIFNNQILRLLSVDKRRYIRVLGGHERTDAFYPVPGQLLFHHRMGAGA